MRWYTVLILMWVCIILLNFVVLPSLDVFKTKEEPTIKPLVIEGTNYYYGQPSNIIVETERAVVTFEGDLQDYVFYDVDQTEGMLIEKAITQQEPVALWFSEQDNQKMVDRVDINIEPVVEVPVVEKPVVVKDDIIGFTFFVILIVTVIVSVVMSILFFITHRRYHIENQMVTKEKKEQKKQTKQERKFDKYLKDKRSSRTVKAVEQLDDVKEKKK